MNRGEVWWVRYRRRHDAHSVLAVPATRTVRGIATEVELDHRDGMPEACALALDNLTLVPKMFFETLICTLGPERMHAACSALSAAVDC